MAMDIIRHCFILARMTKPYAQSCDNNKAPILEVLRGVLTMSCTVWEIGSGTGQHAVHFAAALPHLRWQPTDCVEHLPGMQLWLDEAGLENVMPPLQLDVRDEPWPCEAMEAVFTANTLHIMSWAEVEVLFARLDRYLLPGALLCSYGPFNRDGHYTSESNERFDQWLKARDPLSGIRDLEALVDLAQRAGLALREDHALPANNHLLVWARAAS